jgi:uncharacterized repeat protein (TIGR01451 family)
MGKSKLSAPSGMVLLAVVAGCALLVATPVVANEQPKVEINMHVEREVVDTSDGGEELTHREPVEIANPGDVLVYTLTAVNVGGAPAFNPRMQDPIPDGTVLIPDSVSNNGARIMASLDSGESWHEFPITVKRTAEDGSIQQVPVPAKSYTNLRWELPGQFDPGERRSVSFKVTIQ